MKKIRVWILSSFLLCGLIVNCSEPIYAANHKSKIESNKNKSVTEKERLLQDRKQNYLEKFKGRERLQVSKCLFLLMV